MTNTNSKTYGFIHGEISVETPALDNAKKRGPKAQFSEALFERGMRWPRQKSLEKFKDAIRQKTQRTRSGSMKEIIESTNRTLRGWFNYFQHSIENIFEGLDRWTRGRLRSILRRRHKRKGRARGQDHHRWPNAYFSELGLISLALARAKAANARKEAH